MLCSNPFIRDPSGKVMHANLLATYAEEAYKGMLFGCGQCLACRINRRRVWTARLILESLCHDKAAFVTLTYSDDELPYCYPDYAPSLCKRDLQLFLKRIRFRFRDRLLRFYACGEYGTKRHRPHYHLVLFGVSPDELDPLYLTYDGAGPNSLLLSLWGHGRVHVGEVNKLSVQYVAGYVTKKFVKKGDSLHPEFSLMSLRPGIGFPALDKISSVVSLYNLQDSFHTFRFDGRKWPFGRYLVHKLQDSGVMSVDSRSAVLAALELHRKARAQGEDVVSLFLQSSEQSLIQLERKDKIFNQRSGVDDA